MYVRYPMLPILTGVISTTRNVKIPGSSAASVDLYRSGSTCSWSLLLMPQIESEWPTAHTRQVLVARSVLKHRPGADRRNVHSQATPNKPTPKKKLNRNSITVATIPAAWPPSNTVPARIAMQPHWPAAAKSMSLRRPSLYNQCFFFFFFSCCRARDDEPVNGPDRHQR